MKTANFRDSRFELLRILSMLLIISTHCVKFTLYGNYAFLQEDLSLSFIGSYISIMLGIGSYLFILLTCWFFVDKAVFRSERVLRTAWQTWTTCLLCLLVGIVFRLRSVTPVTVIRELLAPFDGQYWFVTSFILFSLALPLLQSVLSRLSEKQLDALCIVLVVFCPLRQLIDATVLGNMGEFITAFFVIAWMKRNPGNRLQRHWLAGLLLTAALILLPLLARICLPQRLFGLNFSGSGGGLFRALVLRLRKRNILKFFGAICVFCGFLRLPEFHSPRINRLSAHTFGVYLWHYNLVFRAVIWQDLFHTSYWYLSTKLYPAALAVFPILVFLAASLVEALRSRVLDDWLYPRLRWNGKLAAWLDAVYFRNDGPSG